MKTILKKLDLEDILEKEMDLWCQLSPTNSPSINEINTSSLFSNTSTILLSNKITETIQNIKIKKQNDFYKSQMHKKETNITKNKNSKSMKISVNSQQHDDVEKVFDEFDEYPNRNIFINNSKKNNSLKSLILPTTSTQSNSSFIIPNITYINKEINTSHSPLIIPKDTAQAARLKLNAFKYKKKSISLNNNQIESSDSESSSIHKQDLSNIFYTGDEDDLSYLNVL